MAIKIRRISNPDKKLEQWMGRTNESLNLTANKPVVEGNLIPLFEMPDATVVRIQHKLGRKARGWHVADMIDTVSTGRIERVLDTVSELSHLSLKATGWGATIRVAIWVY